jgi:hypothetical protein
MSNTNTAAVKLSRNWATDVVHTFRCVRLEVLRGNDAKCVRMIEALSARTGLPVADIDEQYVAWSAAS